MIIRIDDFPTGIISIPDDLTPHFTIMDCFERHNIPFHLGIVPESLRRFVKPPDIEKLTRYKCLIPAMHGYDHQFDRMNRILTVHNDPQNIRGLVGGDWFEFESRTQEWVNEKLTEGREYLESIFARDVIHYIPVCNRIDEKLITGLINAGFVYVFTIEGNKGAARRMAQVTTEYYGRLEDMTRRYDSLCLHITWEVQTIDRIGFESWENMFKRLIA